MKYLQIVCLVAVAMLAGTVSGAAQVQVAVAERQAGITVELPISSEAVRMPDADRKDALVVTITRDGSVYLATEPMSLSTMRDALKRNFAVQAQRTVYIKADARTSHGDFVKVLDALAAAGAECPIVLAVEPHSPQPGTRVPPAGITFGRCQ